MAKANENNAQFAKAYPRKHFFFEMFTRDISLEDCILDLIDNSIDARASRVLVSLRCTRYMTTPSITSITPA